MMAMRLELTLCLLSAASALRMADLSDKGVGEWILSLGAIPTVADVKNMIESAPQDMTAQKAACFTLRTLSMKDRHLEAQSPFNGKYIPTKFLEEGIGEVYAQAILNILANKEAPENEIGAAATYCMTQNGGLPSTLQVQNHQEKALAMLQNSPHLWDAVIGYYKRFWQTYSPQGDCLMAGLYGTFPGADAPANDFARAGGVELILDWIDHGRTDLNTLQNALCALSDNIQNSKAVGDAIISLDGPKRFTEAVRAIHGAPNQDVVGNGFTLHYQVLEDIIGMLKNDDTDNRTYAKAFIDAGLLDAVIEYMPDDQADLYFQDHCCQALGYLANDNEPVQQYLKHSLLVRTAVKGAIDLNCKPYCHWPRGFALNSQFGEGSTVQPPSTCKFLLWNLLEWSPWREWSESVGHP